MFRNLTNVNCVLWTNYGCDKSDDAWPNEGLFTFLKEQFMP